MSKLSQQHVESYLRRERVWTERLRSEVGSEVVGTVDRITLRDLIAERRREELDELLGEAGAEAAPTELAQFCVLLNRRTGRATARGRYAPKTRRERIIQARRKRARGERLVRPLVDAVEAVGGQVEDTLWLTHSVVATVDADGLVALAARKDVVSVTHAKRVIALALDVSRPLIQADQVESGLGITGAGVDLAILDTGVDGGHVDLTVVTQQDFTGEGVGDFHGHGTHTAGVATGNGTTYRGVAPGANLHDYKLMDSMGSTTDPIAVNAIQTAVADGMDVLSNSWGFTHRDGFWVDPDGTCVLCTAANNATDGSVFVVAAGNEDESTCGTYDTWIRCPGIAELIITVGASDDSDNMAGFSSRGPTPDGRCKPDVTAPGVDIIAARAGTGSDMNGGANPIDANYIEASGTSMACPHVAGLAALMLEKNPALSHAQVKNIMMATAVDIGADRCTEQGAGRVDALAAVNAA